MKGFGLRSFWKRAFGFTLVELIVVIAILAILGTISFISLNGFSESARDSTRITDISNVTKTLELYSVKAGNYPNPSDPSKTVTYSGMLVFTEGSLGDSVIQTLGTFSKKPTDPKLQNIEYNYSVLNTGLKFQVATVLEKGDIAYIPFIDTVFADSSALTYIDGNYNSSTGSVVLTGVTVTFPLPSITTSDNHTGSMDYGSITSSNLFLTNKSTSDVPFSYKKTGVGFAAFGGAANAGTGSGGGGAIAGDPYYDNVVVLMHFDGSNGSTAFTDQKGHAATAFGDAQISTATSKFGGASGRFHGAEWDAKNLITVAGIGTGTYFSTSDWTLESFVYVESAVTNNQAFGIITTRNGGVYSPFNLTMRANAGGTAYNLVFYGSSGNGTWNYTFSTTYNIPLNSWAHVAAVASGGVITFYINGTSVGTLSIAAGLANTFTDMRIGGDWDYGGALTDGARRLYLDELRITRGVARYASNFTVPNSAFPDVQGVLSPICGTSSGAIVASQPTGTAACANGSPINTSSSSSTFSWTCQGSGGLLSDSCKACNTGYEWNGSSCVSTPHITLTFPQGGNIKGIMVTGTDLVGACNTCLSKGGKVIADCMSGIGTNNANYISYRSIPGATGGSACMHDQSWMNQTTEKIYFPDNRGSSDDCSSVYVNGGYWSNNGSYQAYSTYSSSSPHYLACYY